MLKLKVASASVVKQHLETLGARFDEQMAAWGAPSAAYPPCTADLQLELRNHRDDILTGDVGKLRQVIHDVESTAPNLAHYLRHRPAKGSPNWQQPMEDLIKKLGEVFNYSKFIKKDAGWNAYKLVGSHALRICPYCHLHHVNYHPQSTGTPKLELRPPLDHFLPKSIYPYLAVSLYNLVPSCHQCNSSIKGDKDPASGVPHPFDSSTARNLSFGLQASALTLAGVLNGKLDIKVSGNGPWNDFARFFHLQERYQWYLPEVQDLLRRKQAMDEGDPILNSLTRRNYILGFDPKDSEQRALGICLQDIAKQLKVL